MAGYRLCHADQKNNKKTDTFPYDVKQNNKGKNFPRDILELNQTPEHIVGAKPPGSALARRRGEDFKPIVGANLPDPRRGEKFFAPTGDHHNHRTLPPPQISPIA